jgi:DNA repair exonuclease SbcCD ATPase subunit
MAGSSNGYLLLHSNANNIRRKEMSKVKEIKIQNIKGIKVAEYAPNGKNLVTISGANGQGKSSFLESIWIACKGRAKGQTVINNTADHAEVELTTTDGYVINRKFKDDKTTVTVKKDNMSMGSPQQFLDGLIKDIAIDPVRFIAMDSKAQASLIMRMAGIDINAFNAQYKAIYEERTYVNRDMKALTNNLDACIQKTPVERVNVNNLMQEKNEINEKNNLRNSMIYRQKECDEYISNREGYIKNAEYEISKLEEKIEQLKSQIASDKDKIKELLVERATIVIPEIIPSIDIDAKIANASNSNRLADAYDSYVKIKTQLEGKQKESATLSTQLEAITKENYDRIAKINLIPGLSVDQENGILINNVPLSECSHSEKLLLSCKLAVVSAPGLRVIFVDEAQSLDKKNFDALVKFTEENDYQLWAAFVGDAAGEIVIESGEIKK